MRIIVDAMGGDNAPLEIIKGAYQAHKEYNAEIVLVGQQDVIKKVCTENDIDASVFEIVNATQVIAMDDDADAILKKKPDSSMAVGMKMLAEGNGDAFISAGNSGAVCVGATLIVKRIKGIKRPGFAPIMPHFDGGCFMLMDSGASVEARPEMLLQYAYMGSTYMEKVMKVNKPRIGLANVGSEEHKGTELQHKAYELLKNSSLNFIGNVEGREITQGACDVFVCDGFTGNLILKTYEGVAIALMDKLKTLFTKSLKNKLAAGLIMGDLKEMIKEYDYNEYGGAPILGATKPVFKAHGSAKAKTFKNAIRLTMEFVSSGVIEEIENSVRK